MKLLNLKTVFLAIVLSTSSLVNIANAGLINLNSDDLVGTYSGRGASDGRGISFQALKDFSISSVGIEAWLFEQSFDVVIWDSIDGHQVNSELASSSTVIGSDSLSWNDIVINFDFLAGNFYAIGWRPTDGGKGDWANSLTYYHDQSLTKEVASTVNLIDGFYRYSAEGFGNNYHPNLRMNVAMPEPSTLAIFAFGAIGLMARRFKQS